MHDLAFLLPGLPDILRLKEVYPDFKMTCFTIPMSKHFFNQENAKLFKIEKYKQWAEIINSYDWLEVGMHGFAHTKHEADTSYEGVKTMIKAGENLWKQVGLEYKKLFAAPYWQYSYDGFNALKDMGYAIGIDRNNPRIVPEGAKTFTYNWSFEETVRPKFGNTIVGHGHLMDQGVTNSINQTFYNITKQIPRDAKFGFISELINLKDQSYAKEKSSSKEGSEKGSSKKSS